ncbi:MAG: hypothetical protein R2726_05155 [Acidimicrobiales bacterium]
MPARRGAPAAPRPGHHGRRPPGPCPAQVAQGDDPGGDLVLAHQHGEAGAGPVGHLHLRLHGSAAPGAVRGQPGPPQLGGEVARLVAAGQVDDEDLDPLLRGGEHAFGVTRRQDPLDARPEADPGRRRPAERLHQPVVAPATADGALGRLEGGAAELEGGVGVVVEASHQSRLDGEGDPEGPEPGLHPLEVRRRLGRQRVEQQRRVGHHRQRRGPLGVEHPHGVGLDLLLVGRVEVSDPAHQERAEPVDVGPSIARRADAVDHQLDLAQTEGDVDVVQEGDDLDVEVGVVDTDRLHADLVVLPEPVRLGALVAEVRRCVPDLPGHGGRPVLDPRPHDARGALGPQGQVVGGLGLVEEVVHLLAHDVGALAHALEDADVFEHRPLDQAVAGPSGDAREQPEEGFPSGRLGGQHVLGAGGRLEGLGHGRRG